jgi:glutamate-1-semialdehyde aminotransferase
METSISIIVGVGPIIFSRFNDDVNAKVHEEIDRAVLCCMTSELEVDVADLIVEMRPAVDMVRLACSVLEDDAMHYALHGLILDGKK